jgi:undecaprenyl-diphosphatase
VPVADAITHADRAVLDAVAALRTQPLTWLMLFLSLWWVKSVLIGAAGVAADLVRRPRRLPPTLLPVAAAVLLAEPVAILLKGLFDRARPPIADPGFDALTTLPASASMPSGHALTAFAAAGVVAALHPRLRVAALAAAALVALSRVYLGVHFPSDVVVGAVAGLVLAALVLAASAWRPRRAAAGGRRVGPEPRPPG